MGDDDKTCPACGRPKGTGTLLDLNPGPPPYARLAEDVWREFAARYRCPACAEADADA